MHGAQHVLGVLALFKRRRPRISICARYASSSCSRAAWPYIMMNAYDPVTGLLTRPALKSVPRRC
jgi:hypothetical protein